jgi:hypothetical protein
VSNDSSLLDISSLWHVSPPAWQLSEVKQIQLLMILVSGDGDVFPLFSIPLHKHWLAYCQSQQYEHGTSLQVLRSSHRNYRRFNKVGDNSSCGTSVEMTCYLIPQRLKKVSCIKAEKELKKSQCSTGKAVFKPAGVQRKHRGGISIKWGLKCRQTDEMIQMLRI